jgi:hypothetical protein
MITSKPEFKKWSASLLADAEMHVQKILRRVRTARLAGGHNHAKYWTVRYLQSHHAKVLAVLAAYESIKPHRRPSKHLLPTIADRLDPWAGTAEPVRVHALPKGTQGDYRLVHDFGIENRALQHLILRLLQEDRRGIPQDRPRPSSLRRCC